MPSLRESAAAPSPEANLAQLEECLAFVKTRLSAPDYAEFESLLWAVFDPIRAAGRQRAKEG
jgi:hypothetical protein